MPPTHGSLSRASRLYPDRSWRRRGLHRLGERSPHASPRCARRSERPIRSGSALSGVSRSKIRDRGVASDDERFRFSSATLPKRSRRTRSPDALLPVLYLRGISTGDFKEALTVTLGAGGFGTLAEHSLIGWRAKGSTLRICRPPSSAASPPSGRPSMHDMLTCGSTASTCRLGRRTRIARALAVRYPFLWRRHLPCPSRPYLRISRLLRRLHSGSGESVEIFRQKN